MTEEEKKAIEFLKEKMKNWRKYMPEDEELHAEDIVLNLIQKQELEINKLKNKLQNISDEFLKYDWKKATQEQVYNQLKSLYESIFMKEDK